MSDTQTDPQEESQTTPPAQEEKDWKAEYEKAVAESRKWERRSKENAAAAKELDDLKASQLSDLEKAQKAEQDAKRELEEMKATVNRLEWNASVSKDTGIPAEVVALIDASDEDDLKQKAEVLKPTFENKQGEKGSVPVVLGAGSQAQVEPPKDGDWLREALANR